MVPAVTSKIPASGSVDPSGIVTRAEGLGVGVACATTAEEGLGDGDLLLIGLGDGVLEDSGDGDGVLEAIGLGDGDFEAIGNGEAVGVGDAPPTPPEGDGDALFVLYAHMKRMSLKSYSPGVWSAQH